jgi:hypothetical protein
MGGDNAMRASDSDREVVVSALREAFSAGRLTLEEFDERTSAAYASKTWGQLRELTVDLPESPELGIGKPKVPEQVTAVPKDEDPVLTVRVVPMPRRRHRRAPLLPAAMILLLFGVGAGSPVAVALGAVFCFVVLASEFADGFLGNGDRTNKRR